MGCRRSAVLKHTGGTLLLHSFIVSRGVGFTALTPRRFVRGMDPHRLAALDPDVKNIGPLSEAFFRGDGFGISDGHNSGAPRRLGGVCHDVGEKNMFMRINYQNVLFN